MRAASGIKVTDTFFFILLFVAVLCQTMGLGFRSEAYVVALGLCGVLSASKPAL